MKKIIPFFVFCFLFGKCFSQAGEWVWIHGNSIPNQPGNYGVQGIPSPTNSPPSLYEPCEWTDLNGNYWLFGGAQIDDFGDLWKYDPLSNEWTWMKGTGVPNDPGNYGIQGVSSPFNYPPSRSHGITTWADSSGYLWLFGGNSGGSFSDLWRYTISTNEWTWIKGPGTTGQAGIYGTQGIPDSLNNPGARSECASAWTDNNNNLWLFGGGETNLFNDLWRYNIASNQWTWMKGAQTPNQAGIYGTLGVESTANTPGARMAYSHWKDHTGKFWLFGGGNYVSSTDYYNDFWRYNPLTNNWAWMAGSDIVGAVGEYGTKCIASLNRIPTARYENRSIGTDQNGNFWLFGGAQGNIFDRWNDLWMYCVASSQWIYVSGDSLSNPIGNWGTLGVSSPTNKPNGRAGAVCWSDYNTHLYFFGGYSGNYYNDLWKYTIDTACGVCPTSTSIQENNLTNELLVFPNPTNSPLTISFQSSEKQNIELRIYNTLGKQVYFSKEEIAGGKFEKEIKVERFSNGIYFLQVKMKYGVVSKKMVVQH